MSLGSSRKVSLVVAGGNPSAERHFEDTIQRKRTLEEVRRFLPSREIENLDLVLLRLLLEFGFCFMTDGLPATGQ
jgi:hypothetical protein